MIPGPHKYVKLSPAGLCSMVYFAYFWGSGSKCSKKQQKKYRECDHVIMILRALGPVVGASSHMDQQICRRTLLGIEYLWVYGKCRYQDPMVRMVGSSRTSAKEYSE